MLAVPDPDSTEDTQEQDVTRAQTNITRLPEEDDSDDGDDGLVITRMSTSTRWAIGIAAAFAIVILLGFVVDSVFLTETPTTAPPAAPKQTTADKAESPARADIGSPKLAEEPTSAPKGDNPSVTNGDVEKSTPKKAASPKKVIVKDKTPEKVIVIKDNRPPKGEGKKPKKTTLIGVDDKSDKPKKTTLIGVDDKKPADKPKKTKLIGQD